MRWMTHGSWLPLSHKWIHMLGVDKKAMPIRDSRLHQQCRQFTHGIDLIGRLAKTNQWNMTFVLMK
jgi:hypothetical protein